jgi:formylmethanofuran dehydrogenase subunit E
MSINSVDLPEDFRQCVRFHGHICKGLAIGYAAAKAGSSLLGLTAAKDEEIVALVENDSCAVDAIQVLLGCTFGKGNLIFRDWGKQVFTFLDRDSGRAVRLAFKQLPRSEERHVLRKRIDTGEANDAEKELWEKLKDQDIMDLISSNPDRYFEISDVHMDMPPNAQIVTTRDCEICGEATVVGRLAKREGRLICTDCMQKWGKS